MVFLEKCRRYLSKTPNVFGKYIEGFCPEHSMFLDDGLLAF